MKLKKLIALGLTTVMTTGMLVGCSSKPKSDESAKGSEGKITKVAMVTDTGGVNDESFNQSAWSGLEKAKKEFGEDKVDVKYLESKQDADYVPNIETLYEEGYDIIIGVGFKLQPAIEEASKNYPEQQFALIDSVVEAENVTSLLFEDNVSSYLTGLIAGKMTETNKVGFIGGIESEVLDRFDYGFQAGVKDSNPDAEVLRQYTNSFTDSAKGKDIAANMHNKNADIILTAAGACGIGAIEAAKENNKKAIGVDQDQNALAPEHVITSAMKNIDAAVFNLVKSKVEGNYKGGETIVNTLSTGGVGVAPTTDKNVPPDVLTYVNEMSEKVKSGEIKVPQNKEEFDAKYNK
ncbi:BMP family ABC transporter substrate-binding protein [Romboutsia weinsteinii]|uniref:BMP family ABC transporter substrate-binding protein n=1 Tax=Romboutsia weinsteinii TaxID=2020949 RepID=A0A371J018_9FIRM|nr:BMP family ABC transporter substrate-binding protein [Romboutsia weinsteinii]RDY26053.1 BMP family ABC transporter substrate-binding protein [Romboutsia weinsteinii]